MPRAAAEALAQYLDEVRLGYPSSGSAGTTRPCPWSTTGLIGEDDDTSATPKTIFRRRARQLSNSLRIGW
jgi:hypothetical protein